jgi:hypothetical protein
MNTDGANHTGCTVVIITMQMCAPAPDKLHLRYGANRLRNKPKIPYFDGAIFAASDQPFAFTMERHGSDIQCMPFKCNKLERFISYRNMGGSRKNNYRCGRGTGNVVDVDFLVNCRCQETFTIKLHTENGK